jgi:hypothetical protein
VIRSPVFFYQLCFRYGEQIVCIEKLEMAFMFLRSQKHECRKKVWILLHQDFGGQERGDPPLFKKRPLL